MSEMVKPIENGNEQKPTYEDFRFTDAFLSSGDRLEDCPNVIIGIKENCENSLDSKVEGKPLIVQIHLTGKQGKTSIFQCSKIEIRDNGCGMSDDHVINHFCSFRSHDSERHNDCKKTGRYGQGAKQILGYFKDMTIITKESKDNFARRYRLRFVRTQTLERLGQDWNKIAVDFEHGTKIILENPGLIFRLNAAFDYMTVQYHDINIEYLKRVIGRFIPFHLDKDISIKLFKNRAETCVLKQNWIVTESIQKDLICSIKGTNHSDTIPVLLKGCGIKNKKIINDLTIPAISLPDGISCEFNLFVSKDTIKHRFGECILYWANSPVFTTDSVSATNSHVIRNFLDNKHEIAPRICGYIIVQGNNKLKDDLRINRHELNPNSERVIAIRRYLQTIVSKLEAILSESNKSNDSEFNKLSSALAKVLNKMSIRFRVNGRSNNKKKNGKQDIYDRKFENWFCKDCKNRWRVEFGISPVYCTKCNSINITRAKNSTRKPPVIVQVNRLPDFIPVMFNQDKNSILVSMNHPDNKKVLSLFKQQKRVVMNSEMVFMRHVCRAIYIHNTFDENQRSEEYTKFGQEVKAVYEMRVPGTENFKE